MADFLNLPFGEQTDEQLAAPVSEPERAAGDGDGSARGDLVGSDPGLRYGRSSAGDSPSPVPTPPDAAQPERIHCKMCNADAEKRWLAVYCPRSSCPNKVPEDAAGNGRGKFDHERTSEVATPDAAQGKPLELLPCPFCGGRADYEQTEGALREEVRWTVGCLENENSNNLCMAYQSLTTFATKREARLAWNTRSTPRAREGDAE